MLELRSVLTHANIGQEACSLAEQQNINRRFCAKAMAAKTLSTVFEEAVQSASEKILLKKSNPSTAVPIFVQQMKTIYRLEKSLENTLNSYFPLQRKNQTLPLEKKQENIQWILDEISCHEKAFAKDFTLAQKLSSFEESEGKFKNGVSTMQSSVLVKRQNSQRFFLSYIQNRIENSSEEESEEIESLLDFAPKLKCSVEEISALEDALSTRRDLLAIKKKALQDKEKRKSHLETFNRELEAFIRNPEEKTIKKLESLHQQIEKECQSKETVSFSHFQLEIAKAHLVLDPKEFKSKVEQLKKELQQLVNLSGPTSDKTLQASLLLSNLERKRNERDWKIVSLTKTLSKNLSFFFSTNRPYRKEEFLPEEEKIGPAFKNTFEAQSKLACLMDKEYLEENVDSFSHFYPVRGGAATFLAIQLLRYLKQSDLNTENSKWLIGLITDRNKNSTDPFDEVKDIEDFDKDLPPKSFIEELESIFKEPEKAAFDSKLLQTLESFIRHLAGQNKNNKRKKDLLQTETKLLPSEIELVCKDLGWTLDLYEDGRKVRLGAPEGYPVDSLMVGEGISIGCVQKV
jgi:hypothetical protein